MRTNIAETVKCIELAQAWLAKWETKLIKAVDTRMYVGDQSRPFVFADFSDAALLGEVLGRDGWTRRYDTYGCRAEFDWVKIVDGVEVKIKGAEKIDMAESPVPERAFPLMIEDVRETEGEGEQI